MSLEKTSPPMAEQTSADTGAVPEVLAVGRAVARAPAKGVHRGVEAPGEAAPPLTAVARPRAAHDGSDARARDRAAAEPPGIDAGHVAAVLEYRQRARAALRDGAELAGRRKAGQRDEVVALQDVAPGRRARVHRVELAERARQQVAK